MNNQQQSPKMFCRMCGGQIDRDSKFCPLCGKKLEDSPVVSPVADIPTESNIPAKSDIPAAPTTPAQTAIPTPPQPPAQPTIPASPQAPVQPAIPTPTQMSTGDQNIQQDTNTSAPTRPLGKGAVIGGICAAVLVLAVIISVAVKGSNPFGQYAVLNFAESTQEPQTTWAQNILMPDVADQYSNKNNKVFGSDITRNEIYSITILDSLAAIPDNAWDVSADQSGKVMAWAVSKNTGYELYIGAEGGVAANQNCESLFRSYTNVVQIQMNGNFHTENTTNMSYMFYDCGKLTSLDVSGCDTSNVTTMKYMFGHCVNLTSLDASGFNTANVSDMSYMFTNCSSLTSLDVSGLDTSNAMDMNHMFSNCSSLTSLDVGGLDTSNASNALDMSYMFTNCSSLTNLDISGFRANVVNVQDMFDSCNNLAELYLNEAVTPALQTYFMKIPSTTTVYQSK